MHRQTLIAAILALPCACAFAEVTSIYQQRDAEGNVVLTDRPAPTSLTTRTWQIRTPNADVSRQREAEMRAEAEAVSARVQRTIDRQNAQAEAEAIDRRRAAEREDERRRAEQRYADGTVVDPYASAWTIAYPYRQVVRAPGFYGRARLDDAPARPRAAPRPAARTALSDRSGSPESR